MLSFAPPLRLAKREVNTLHVVGLRKAATQPPRACKTAQDAWARPAVRPSRSFWTSIPVRALVVPSLGSQRGHLA